MLRISNILSCGFLVIDRKLNVIVAQYGTRVCTYN